MRFFIEAKHQPFASDWRQSRGRVLPEQASPTRSDFQRDRDRIIHSTAFRRLKHKTQVFVEHEGDHYRTRLTHTLEVSQIARSIARALGLDEDLAEALALSHDLGHPPFGHTGEDALDQCLAAVGGFDHNAQALRIVTALERRYAAHDGLNLTIETLEGLVKHNGPLVLADGAPVPRYAARGVPREILAFDAVTSIGLEFYAGAEAQVAAIADDIAYNAHDLDDGLRAGLFRPTDVADHVPFIAAVIADIEGQWGQLEPVRLVHEIGRRVITRMVEDVISESEQRLLTLAPRTVEDIRKAGRAMIAFSTEFEGIDRSIKTFLFAHMYRHPTVLVMRERASRIVTDLFGRYAEDLTTLPADWHAQTTGLTPNFTLLHIRDYIAGMTDRFAILEHRRLFDVTPDLH